MRPRDVLAIGYQHVVALHSNNTLSPAFRRDDSIGLICCTQMVEGELAPIRKYHRVLSDTAGRQPPLLLNVSLHRSGQDFDRSG